MLGMSPYAPKGMHHGLKIQRIISKISNGVRSPSCDYLTLYVNLSGRVFPLRKFVENVLQQPLHHGEDKGGERKVIITPRFPLRKMTTGDILVIPWGVRPNTFVPPNIPDGAAEIMIIELDEEEKVLKWDGIKYSDEWSFSPLSPEPTITTLELIEGVWCFKINDISDVCFENEGSFVCQKYPEGYKFKRFTGYDARFKILNIDEMQDNLGRLAYYLMSVETLNDTEVILQE